MNELSKIQTCFADELFLLVKPFIEEKEKLWQNINAVFRQIKSFDLNELSRKKVTKRPSRVMENPGQVEPKTNNSHVIKNPNVKEARQIVSKAKKYLSQVKWRPDNGMGLKKTNKKLEKHSKWIERLTGSSDDMPSMPLNWKKYWNVDLPTPPQQKVLLLPNANLPSSPQQKVLLLRSRPTPPHPEEEGFLNCDEKLKACQQQEVRKQNVYQKPLVKEVEMQESINSAVSQQSLQSKQQSVQTTPSCEKKEFFVIESLEKNKNEAVFVSLNPDVRKEGEQLLFFESDEELKALLQEVSQQNLNQKMIVEEKEMQELTNLDANQQKFTKKSSL